MEGELEERARRRWAAVEAVSLGRGGMSAVAEATGLARSTIQRGIEELESPAAVPLGYQRRPGAGRRRLEEVDAGLQSALGVRSD